jgi:hypothetical protein
VWLPWDWALYLAAALLLLVIGAHNRAPGWRPGLVAFAQEAALVSVIYAVWQLGNTITVTGTERAVQRGRTIWDVERDLHLPSEVATQHAALHAHWLIKLGNVYYIAAHVPVLGIFLFWCWFRHRDAYPRWRTRLFLATFASMLIQLIPVAPPRLTIPGIVDTGLLYGPDVYDPSGRGFAPQLAAMPSVHCVWALLVGIAAVRVSTSRWRWLGMAHAVLTITFVVVTGNHYWLDAVVGGALLALAVPAQLALHSVWGRIRGRVVGDVDLAPLPEPALVGR